MEVDWAVIEMVRSLEFWRMAFFWTVALMHSYFRLLFAGPLSAFFPFLRPTPPLNPRRRLLFTPDSESEIKRPICIITGATSGLGAAAAKALAGEGYHVLLAGRCPQLLCKTIQEIKQKHEDAYLKSFQVDLSSIQSIMKFGNAIRQWLLDSNLHPSVQLLVNNAGILAASCRATIDGYDQMLETNYISAFVLTHLLLPLLKNSPMPSRVVNVTSFTHLCVSDIEVDVERLARKNLSCVSTGKKYPFARVYECSKLCILLFSYELHRQLRVMDSSRNISVIAVDSGVVETGIMRELPPCLSRLAFTVLRALCLLQSPENGAASIVDAALAPPDISGEYFFGGKGRSIKSSSLSYNGKLSTELWSTSFTLFEKARDFFRKTEKA